MTRYAEQERYERALAILYRMGLENIGWRGWIRRWAYPSEPLRNDAANLVREAGFQIISPLNTRLVSENADTKREAAS